MQTVFPISHPQNATRYFTWLELALLYGASVFSIRARALAPDV